MQASRLHYGIGPVNRSVMPNINDDEADHEAQLRAADDEADVSETDEVIDAEIVEDGR